MGSLGRLEEAILENHPLMKSTFCLLYVLYKDSFIIAHKRRANYISSFTEYEIKFAYTVNSFSNVEIYLNFITNTRNVIKKCLRNILEHKMSHLRSIIFI